MARMRQHPWPGNVRELENVIQRALLMADTDEILPDDLGLPLPVSVNLGTTEPPTVGLPIANSPTNQLVTSSSPPENASGGAENTALSETISSGDAVDMRSIEREHILQVLRTVNGSRRRAVELLGISERALRYKLKSYREEGHEIA